jgi:hypothetical protein
MTAVAAFQPENIGGETIVITTTEADGESHERVLSPIDYRAVPVGKEERERLSVPIIHPTDDAAETSSPWTPPPPPRLWVQRLPPKGFEDESGKAREFAGCWRLGSGEAEPATMGSGHRGSRCLQFSL